MTNQHRILILTADAGFGHRSAANAIAAAFEERYARSPVAACCQVDVVNPLDEPHAPAFLRRQQSDYDKLVQQIPDLYKFGYEISDASLPTSLIDNALTVLLYEALRDVVRRYQPDAIVTTYPVYQAPLWAVFTVDRRSIPLLTVVTDLATVHKLWFHPAADLCLVPTERVRELALEADLRPEQVRITGIPVHPRLLKHEKTAKELREEFGWLPDRPAALVVGSKRVRGLVEMLQGVNHSGLPLQLALVAGGDEGLYNRIQETEWHLPVQAYNFVKNMPELMAATDLIVCKAGGLIVTESLAAGLPLLLVDVLPGQETGNAEYVVDNGAGALASSPLEVLETLYHWLDHDRALLAERAANARRLGRPEAAFEVAELALEAAEYMPSIQSRRGLLNRTRLIALLNRYGVRLQSG